MNNFPAEILKPLAAMTLATIASNFWVRSVPKRYARKKTKVGLPDDQVRRATYRARRWIRRFNKQTVSHWPILPIALLVGLGGDYLSLFPIALWIVGLGFPLLTFVITSAGESFDFASKAWTDRDSARLGPIWQSDIIFFPSLMLFSAVFFPSIALIVLEVIRLLLP